MDSNVMDVDTDPKNVAIGEGKVPEEEALKEEVSIVPEKAGPRRIKALDPNVVNKIAAGEIIIAPVNALKEIMENAVDAGSTALEIVVKDGGLKLLQVTDNGCGIEKEDLAILCERHTTSKLSAFEDLESIATYGFRGEALSSISQIAHLTVTTKTANSPVAWQAVYQDGRMVPPKPGQRDQLKAVAGRPGTAIKVEDMFYNVPTRRRAFRSPAEEYNKIIDMVGRYSVHCSHVAFSCRKQGDASSGLSIIACASTVDRIRQVHSSSVGDELVEFSAKEQRWGFKAHGYATNANYSHKKTTLLLFINHRCVESTTIRKALEQMYAPFLPKGGHPFVYLSLEIDPARVDVNVHPTKREVHFLNEDEIIQAVCDSISAKLSEHDKSRTFMTQTLLPGVSLLSGSSGKIDVPSPTTTPAPSAKRRRYSNSLVRTDNSARKITTMFQANQIQSELVLDDGAGSPDGKEDLKIPMYQTNDRDFTKCNLRSVKELRAEVRADMHNDLTEVLGNHTFVGIVDEHKRLAAVQSGVKLYLLDYGLACFEYFYQVGVTDFGNFGCIKFSPPLHLRETLMIAAQSESEAAADGEDFDPQALADKVANQIIERREMLQEYFSLEITPSGELVSIPLLVRGYTPALSKLPRFLLRLGPKVNWNDEKGCFESFLRELAMFYAPEQLPPLPHDKQATENEEIDSAVAARRQHVRWALEHVLFPAFKARMVATSSMMKQGVVEIADLKGLYRVFERC
ncbi:DNA mismatch repair protein Mlh1 [Ceratocystis pirilliformis]|uniref:DNA mismatch repair protein Mlh1 n=1 Tax=Ceratocystis pirilliformis TaxID=259994 RepID=A0ABR3ZJS0_9PEZI